MLKISKNIIFSGCVLLLFLTGSTYAETGKKPDPDAVVRGKTLYKKHCIECHQKDGIGEMPIPLGIRHPDYVTAMPLNETSHAWHHGDAQLVNTILNGTRRTKRMPVFEKVLSKKEANDVVAYVKSLWSPRIIACQGPKHMSCMH